jgi:hypothetical protein
MVAPRRLSNRGEREDKKGEVEDEDRRREEKGREFKARSKG